MKGEEGGKGEKKQGTNKAYRESEKIGEREERRVEEVKGRRKKYRSETGQKGTSIQQHISERTRFETAKCVGVRRARKNFDKYSVL